MRFPKFKMRIPTRILNPKNPADSVVLLRRFMDKGLISPLAVKMELIKASEKDMREKVRKARKRGETLTVDNLTRTLKDSPEFMKFCNEQDLDLAFFEGLAESAIKDGGR